MHTPRYPLFIFFFFSSRRRHTRLTCDWSSDVCSSDLHGVGRLLDLLHQLAAAGRGEQHHGEAAGGQRATLVEIGRASCRERVEISVGAVSLKKKKRRESRAEEEGEREQGSAGGW